MQNAKRKAQNDAKTARDFLPLFLFDKFEFVEQNAKRKMQNAKFRNCVADYRSFTKKRTLVGAGLRACP